MVWKGKKLQFWNKFKVAKHNLPQDKSDYHTMHAHTLKELDLDHDHGCHY